MLIYLDGIIRSKSGEFEELFGRVIDSFYHEASLSSIAMWSFSIEELSSSGQSNESSLYQAS